MCVCLVLSACVYGWYVSVNGFLFDLASFGFIRFLYVYFFTSIFIYFLSSQDVDPVALLEGVKMTQTVLNNCLSNFGITPFDAVSLCVCVCSA